jgi:hypothetical protein
VKPKLGRRTKAKRGRFWRPPQILSPEDLVASHSGMLVEQSPWQTVDERPKSRGGLHSKNVHTGRTAGTSGHTHHRQKVQQPESWETGYSGLAYTSPDLPTPESWHRDVPPWEDPPNTVAVERAGDDAHEARPGHLAAAHLQREIETLSILMSPGVREADEASLRIAIKAMRSLPIRWVAWQLLDAHRENRSLEAKVALLRECLQRIAKHDPGLAVVSEMFQESLGDSSGTEAVQDSVKEPDVVSGIPCLWPSTSQADLDDSAERPRPSKGHRSESGSIL